MGDSGSMFIGFFLASAALVNVSGGRSRSLASVLAVPLLVLFIPIFDTPFVTILRKLSGRAASQGGRDHTSHRLVALGMSERRAVLMLYGLAALSGFLATTVRQLKFDVSLALIAGFTLALTLLGVYLAGVKGYDEEEQARVARDKPLFTFLVDLSYKRRIFEVLLDVFLMVFAKAVAGGSLVSILILLFKFRFQGFSRAVFVIDALVMFLLLSGSRVAFRLFRRVLPAGGASKGRRVLIYGAGDAGELLLRELLNNRELSYAPVGFIDDDRKKQGKVIHGLRVYGGNGMLAKIVGDQQIEQLLISTPRISADRLAEIARECEASNIELKRMSIRIEDVDDHLLPQLSRPASEGD